MLIWWENIDQIIKYFSVCLHIDQHRKVEGRINGMHRLQQTKAVAISSECWSTILLRISLVHKQTKAWKLLIFLIQNEKHMTPETYLKLSDVTFSKPLQETLIPWLLVVYILKQSATMLRSLLCLCFLFKLWILKFKICIVTLWVHRLGIDWAFIQMFVHNITTNNWCFS